FLQRAYDQILHDVCLQNLHVILAIDRSGLVGQDGATHQGIFDMAYLSHIPNMTIIAPKNRYELTKAMEYAVQFDGPIAVKYSRGDAYYGLKEKLAPIVKGKSEILFEGEKIALIAVGNMVEEAVAVYERLKAKGHTITLVNARFLKPLDEELLLELAKTHSVIITLEEEIYQGGFGQTVSAFYMQQQIKDVTVKNLAIYDTFVEHGEVSDLRKYLHLDADSIERVIMRHI
ncbi:MAG: 1-deoxy-D-xylulose-5-phosphate synthase, partial [Lachnospiraceae bacterium]|nr:1-deoxy-D-xylulose-5-phosphate synthase [Lachnospiraceae bacterium]